MGNREREMGIRYQQLGWSAIHRNPDTRYPIPNTRHPSTLPQALPYAAPLPRIRLCRIP